MIYTEAYVITRGGPGVSTTFLAHELVQTATIQFDLGEGGAMSVIYFLIVLTRLVGVLLADRAKRKGCGMKQKFSLAPAIYVTLLMIPVYWLIVMSFKSNGEIFSGITPFPHARHWRTTISSSATRTGISAMSTPRSMRCSTWSYPSLSPFPQPTPFRATASLVTGFCCSASLPSA